MDNITASEIAGFGVGTLLLCATIAAPRIDAFVSSSQRSSLGMCKRCGDLKLIASCTRCEGVGAIKSDGPFSFTVMDDFFDSIGGEESIVRSVPCPKCRAKGRFKCPDCC